MGEVKTIFAIVHVMRKEETLADEVKDSREEDNTIEEHEHKKVEFLNNKKPMI